MKICHLVNDNHYFMSGCFLLPLIVLLKSTAVYAIAPDALTNAQTNCVSRVPISSIGQLSHLLKNCNITSIESLMQSLSPTALSKYLLVYDSKSTQMGTSDRPRIIVYGAGSDGSTNHSSGAPHVKSDETASLTFGISGNPADPRYNDLELYEFNHSTKTFNFYNIKFLPEFGAPPVISEKNPSKFACLSCHGDQPRPNWNQYPMWPGVFGSDDPENNRVYESPINGKVVYIALERSFVERYLKNKNSDRYQYLGDPLSDTSYTVRSNVNYFNPETNAIEFNFKISGYNFEKIARQIKNDQALRPFRYALLANTSCVGPSNSKFKSALDFLPKNFTSKKSLTQYAKERCESEKIAHKMDHDRQIALVGEVATSRNSVQESESAKINCNDPSNLDYNQVAGLYLILENKGFSTRDLSMRFDRAGAFDDGVGGIDTGLEEVLWEELLDPVLDADLYNRFKSAMMKRRSSYYLQPPNRLIDEVLNGKKVLDQSICDTLKMKSLASFK